MRLSGVTTCYNGDVVRYERITRKNRRRWGTMTNVTDMLGKHGVVYWGIGGQCLC